MAYKGKFRPKNPKKYKGDAGNITYRSLWELKFFKIADTHPDILWWASEEHVVVYTSPIDGKRHRYFPDVVLNKIDRADGRKKTIMIEIKPYAQTRPPDIRNRNKTPSGRVSRRYLNEVKTYGINEAKWKAAKEYCADRGWEFIIMTEHELGIK